MNLTNLKTNHLSLSKSWERLNESSNNQYSNLEFCIIFLLHKPRNTKRSKVSEQRNNRKFRLWNSNKYTFTFEPLFRYFI